MGKLKLASAFNPPRRPKKVAQGYAGYDNPRENIDPHIRTKAVSTKEVTLSDGAAAGYVMNDANGVLSGGNPGGGGGDVTKVGTPVNNQIGIWTGDGTIEGVTSLTYDGTNLAIAGGTQINLDDNEAAGIFEIAQGANKYMCIATTNGSEAINFGCGAAAAKFTITQTAVTTGVNFGVTGNITVSGTVDGIDIATDVAANTSHRNDNTQAHSDYLLNSGADVAVGPLTITADNSTADQAYVPMVLYNTDATPPAASGFPVGTLYVQYTA